MNDKELEEYIRKIEPNFNTHLEKDTIEMNLEYYNMLEERMVRLINKTNNLQSKIDKAIEYIEKNTRWFDSEYASIYGELCDCEGYNSNRLEVMVNPSNLLNILKEDK